MSHLLGAKLLKKHHFNKHCPSFITPHLLPPLDSLDHLAHLEHLECLEYLEKKRGSQLIAE